MAGKVSDLKSINNKDDDNKVAGGVALVNHVVPGSSCRKLTHALLSY